MLGLLAGAVALLAPVVPALAATSFAPVLTPRAARPPAGARDLGRIAPRTELRLTIALRPRHAAALAADAAGVSRAGAQYHHYLTVAQFARRFGPSFAQLRSVRAELRARGLRVGPTSANRLAIVVRGSARVTADAFGTAIDRYVLHGGAGGYAAVGQPRLAGPAGALVQGIVGLDSIAPRASITIRRRRPSRPRRRSQPGHPSRARGRSQPRHRRGGAAWRQVHGRERTHASGHVSVGGPQACGAASSEASRQWGYTAPQIAAHYGLSGFHAAGDEGSGVTIALYELEPFSASDIAAYQACMGTSTPIGVTSVDGGPGTGAGSGEAASDIEDVIGLAPRAQIQVYEGPPTGQGAYDTYSAIVSQDVAQVVSTSWGLCEAEVGRAELIAENTLFEEAAVQGQTVLAAAGDSGTNDCGNGQLSVDDPSSQPWVTSVGGTHLLTAGDTVWNDSAGATGGGASSMWSRPAWQAGLPAQAAVSCGDAGYACREVPDISADADPASGYTVFFRGGWRTVGGTSVAAPTIAALAALAEAAPGCAGRRLGFLNPTLYADASDIQDVTEGENGYAGVGGFSAGPGYDMASGLGTPGAALGPALCGDALAVSAPAPQGWASGRPVSLQLSARSSLGAPVAWSASGLPAGVSLGGRTGRLRGVPRVSGSFTVTITATDADGATQTTSLPVTISPPAARAAGHRRSHPTRTRRRSARHSRSRSAWRGR